MLERWLFDTRPAMRRFFLAVAIVAVFGIGFLNNWAEQLGAEVEALYFIPIAVVAWLYSRRIVMAFTAFTVVAAVISCVASTGFPPAQIAFESFMHAGSFSAAAFIVGLLGTAMRSESRRAHYDSLTEAANASRFHECAQGELAQGERHGQPVTVAFIDIDDFKSLNDGHGHLAGDEALRSLAELMRGELRGSDMVGRLGGDEFGILLPDTSAETARSVLERIRLSIDTFASSKGWPISASIGATCVSEAAFGVPADTIIKQADSLMYRVKSEGKNGVLVEEYD